MLRLLILSALSLSLFTACGGKKEDDEDDKRPVEHCKDACERAARCEGAVDGYLEQCNQSCEDLAQLAYEAGCLDDLEAAVKCSEREFECDVNEPICESELAAFTSCFAGGGDGDSDAPPEEAN